MRIEGAGMTHVGKVRQKNEDNFYINKAYKKDLTSFINALEDNRKRKKHVYAVCDGMGGENYGELASLTAMEVLRRYDNRDIRNSLEQYIQNANRRICGMSEDSHIGRMGTTLALFVSDNVTADLCNIGDSRIYRFRRESLEQLSKDHTHVQELIDSGFITTVDANKSKKRHILTQHLGISEDDFIIEPYIRRNIELIKGDVFLLCSDGLTDMLKNDDIKELIGVNKNKSPKDMVAMLIKAALDNGGRDNVTAVVIKIC